MERDQLDAALLTPLSGVVARTIGLHFPPDRHKDLAKGLAGAARELGYSGAGALAEHLALARPGRREMQVLASHLTVGETYFFRERAVFDALGRHILPALVRKREHGDRRVRVWSAACCTGEEPYSLAILLRQVLPKMEGWQVTVLATDINERFLRKAEEGVYGEWSFRNAPEWLKGGYFRRTDDGRYGVVPEIRQMVTFGQLNLVEDQFPSLLTNTNAMDLIFCRNVLMYFLSEEARRVMGKLYRALKPGGWLAVAPSETSHAMLPQFEVANFGEAILHRKPGNETGECHWRGATVEPREIAPEPVITGTGWLAETVAPVVVPEPVADVLEQAAARYEQGCYLETVELLQEWPLLEASPEPRAFSLLTRALANQGELARALEWCRRWVAADKLDPLGHYLQAVILQELGDGEPAVHSLQRALYLDPDFVLAHFAMGGLQRRNGDGPGARRHFSTALRLLHGLAPGELLRESDGMTVGRLIEIIGSILEPEAGL